MARTVLKLVPAEPSLLDQFRARDALRAELVLLDDTIAAAVRSYSYERGFCVPMRELAVRRELEADHA